MALLPIIVAPDPRLKRIAGPVDSVDDGVRRLIDDMLETMYAAPGIGLAAPQVGILKRVIVVDVGETDGEKDGGGDEIRKPAPVVMANPELMWASEETETNEEGCLSLPDQFSDVRRPTRARIRYLDRENEIREIEVEGLLATCIQHEIDHLDGVLFVDHISALKRGMILRRLTKAKKAKAGAGV